MTRAILAVLGLLAFGGGNSYAQNIGAAPAGLQFTVPGVTNFNGMATVFTCTSTHTSAQQTVTVNVFDENGLQNGTATKLLDPGKSVRFGTQSVTALTVDLSLASTAVHSGAAQIISNVNKKLICSAVVMDATGATSLMASLPVLYKFTQK